MIVAFFPVLWMILFYQQIFNLYLDLNSLSTINLGFLSLTECRSDSHLYWPCYWLLCSWTTGSHSTDRLLILLASTHPFTRRLKWLYLFSISLWVRMWLPFQNGGPTYVFDLRRTKSSFWADPQGLASVMRYYVSLMVVFISDSKRDCMHESSFYAT